ncbi:MAG: NAD-dependent epimerase/dehydratase family protein, partial [Novosphingobium sp.]
RRILVTGATGGLGLAIVREALARGHRVVATGRSPVAGEALQDMGAEFVPRDLAGDHAAAVPLLDGCDSVIHAAALSASWGPACDFVKANVTMTRRLLDTAGRKGVQRFVFVSSPSIFAAYADRVSIGENDAPTARPLNLYAQTKLAAERLVLAPRGDTMACCAIRPRALVGQGDRVMLPRLAQLARRARMPLPGGGKALIELTDLRDAAWAVCEAEERAPSLVGRAINISGGGPMPVRDVAEHLAASLGEHPRLVTLPLWLARPLAAAMESVAHLRSSQNEPVLTRYTLATLGWTQTFDQEPARRLLGYRPRHDALESLLVEARKMAAA